MVTNWSVSVSEPSRTKLSKEVMPGKNIIGVASCSSYRASVLGSRKIRFSCCGIATTVVKAQKMQDIKSNAWSLTVCMLGFFKNKKRKKKIPWGNTYIGVKWSVHSLAVLNIWHIALAFLIKLSHLKHQSNYQSKQWVGGNAAMTECNSLCLICRPPFSQQGLQTISLQ